MNKAEKKVLKHVQLWVEKNWDIINLEGCYANGETPTKESFFKELKADSYLSMWVLTELMNNSSHVDSDINYLERLKVTPEIEHDFEIVNIDGSYIRYEWMPKEIKFDVRFAKKKSKQIIYFE